MTEQELHIFLKNNYPQENEKCEWKEFKSLKHQISGRESDDVISYISAIANMKGGHLIIGVEDNTLNIVGIQDFHSYNSKNVKIKIISDCPNLSSEGFDVQEYKTTAVQSSDILTSPKIASNLDCVISTRLSLMRCHNFL